MADEALQQVLGQVPAAVQPVPGRLELDVGQRPLARRRRFGSEADRRRYDSKEQQEQSEGHHLAHAAGLVPEVSSNRTG